MRPEFVLVDFENLQPKDLALLDIPRYEVVVFVGAQQRKIALELASALQPRGVRGRYVQISGNGPNALDFHIAFYLGELSVKQPNAAFHVISKDTGFDPLIEHLRSRKIDVQRHESLSALLPPAEDKVVAVIARLRSMGPARPRRRKTLASTINAVCGKELDEGAIQVLIEALASRQQIAMEEGKVTYPAFKGELATSKPGPAPR